MGIYTRYANKLVNSTMHIKYDYLLNTAVIT